MNTELLKKHLGYLEKRRSTRSEITGVPSGTEVDTYTLGWQNGELYVVAGRPSMGKTAFILTAARNAVLHPDETQKSRAAFFSLEMKERQIVHRLLTMEARVDAHTTKKGRVKDEEFKRLIDGASKLITIPFYIESVPGIDVYDLLERCHKLKEEKAINQIYIDSFQLLTAKDKVYDNRWEEMVTIARELKNMAMTLDLPVIVTSQLSRQVEQRGGDKRPELPDLSESGTIEQIADVVIFIYRPEYYGITTTAGGESTTGLAELIIGKNRNGPVGTTRMFFVKEYARFERLKRVDDNISTKNDNEDGAPF